MFRKPPVFLLSFGVAAIAASGILAEEPIDVGNHKQLFIDETLIDSRRNVELVMNPPYQTGEVLITADQPWEEGGNIYVYSSVLKDGDRVRIWYDFVKPTGPGPYDHQRRVGYAESRDGIRFVKPHLGIHEIDGSKDNNVVLSGVIGGCAVWIDPNAPPKDRYKTQAKAYPSGEFHIHSSPDGIHWSLWGSVNPQGPHDTQTIIFWDRNIDRYALYGRHWDKDATNELNIRCRGIRRAEMANLKEIHNTGLALLPDAIDQATYSVPKGDTPVDYYGATVFPYEEGDRAYIMLAQAYWHWMPQSGKASMGPATQDVRLAVSRDGRSFQLVGDRMPFLRLGPSGRFDSRWAWAMPNPLRMGDEIWIYYAGSNVDHDGQIDPASPGGKRQGAISRAVMRLDGFVSADASCEDGELTTRLLQFDGKQLVLNLDTSAGGACRVELLDAQRQPIPGYSGDAAGWTIGNSVRLPVRWSEKADLSALAGKPLRIRFALRNCKLYAFQFAP